MQNNHLLNDAPVNSARSGNTAPRRNARTTNNGLVQPGSVTYGLPLTTPLENRSVQNRRASD
ncbi:MAG: hypothetical protein WBD34_18050 [Burkholderiaceae bacterium]